MLFPIGGNEKASIEVSQTQQNDIGEHVQTWQTVATLNGWIDYANGEAGAANYHAMVEGSTHVFVCDYVQLPGSVTSENARLVCGGKSYVIVMIDDPMGLHKQLEIYLKYTGGQ